ncbi:WD40-repeat-containing domain protein [Ochromonadaceae sp. CCMP2298]|nr:WD40-repeat-containing domain protein [Ochromonadaceae sp. CCMP2298]
MASKKRTIGAIVPSGTLHSFFGSTKKAAPSPAVSTRSGKQTSNEEDGDEAETAPSVAAGKTRSEKAPSHKKGGDAARKGRSGKQPIKEEEEEEDGDELVAAPVASKAKVGGLSSYEEERLANIKRNEEFLASLGIQQAKASLQSLALPKAPPRRKSAPMKREVVDAPVRRSSRVTVEKLQEEISRLEGGDAQALEAKQRELGEMLAKREAPYQVTEVLGYSNHNEERIDPGPIAFSDMLYDMGKLEDAPGVLAEVQGFVQHMGGGGGGARKGKASPAKKSASSSIEEYRRQLASLTCDDTDIAKLTANRVACTYIHPSESKLLIAAGDKTGELGLWDVDKAAASEVQAVYKYKPHVSSLCQILGSPARPGSMYTVSYDGTIRYLDFAKDQICECFRAPENKEDMFFTDACFRQDHPDCLFVSSSDSFVALLDLRAGKYQWRREAYSGYKINSVQQHPTDPNAIITAEKSVISIYDLRKGGATQALQATTNLTLHSKSNNAAYVSPDGQYLVSVSQDNTIRTWSDFMSPKVAPACVVRNHDNHTGRWLSTLKPVFLPQQPHCYLTGSMSQPRRMEVFSIVSQGSSKSSQSSGGGGFSVDLLTELQSEYAASVCSRNAVHPTLDVIVGGNSSGRVHVFRKH